MSSWGLIGGAMAGAMGGMMINEVAEKRKSEREMEALKQQKAMLMDLKKEELAYSAQLLSEQQAQVRELVMQMPTEVRSDPFKTSMYLAMSGHGDLAKAIADVGQGQASAAASQASANKNNAEAASAPAEMEMKWAKHRAEIAKIVAETGKTHAETADLKKPGGGTRANGTALQKDAQWLIDNGLAGDRGDAFNKLRSDKSESDLRSLTQQILADPRNIRLSPAEARKQARAILDEEGRPEVAAPAVSSSKPGAPAASRSVDLNQFFK